MLIHLRFLFRLYLCLFCCYVLLYLLGYLCRREPPSPQKPRLCVFHASLKTRLIVVHCLTAHRHHSYANVTILDLYTLQQGRNNVFYAPEHNFIPPFPPPFLYEHAALSARMLIFVFISTSTDNSAPNVPDADEASTRTIG